MGCLLTTERLRCIAIVSLIVPSYISTKINTVRPYYPKPQSYSPPKYSKTSLDEVSTSSEFTQSTDSRFSYDDIQSRRELSLLKSRIDKLEKAVSSGGGGTSKARGSVNELFDSITAGTMELNAKNVEICAIISWFLIGSILGASIFDRLWLMGGITMAWWASEVVNSNSRSGMLTRRIGVQLAQFIKDIQEKYNQIVIFYRTGKFAYHSSKIWESYDMQFSITQRVDMFKKLAMNRAVEFNNYLGETRITDQISDVWKVIASAPTEAKKLNIQYGVTNTIVNTVNKVGMNIGSSMTRVWKNILSENDNNNGYNNNNNNEEGEYNIDKDTDIMNFNNNENENSVWYKNLFSLPNTSLYTSSSSSATSSSATSSSRRRNNNNNNNNKRMTSSSSSWSLWPFSSSSSNKLQRNGKNNNNNANRNNSQKNTNKQNNNSGSSGGDNGIISGVMGWISNTAALGLGRNQKIAQVSLRGQVINPWLPVWNYFTSSSSSSSSSSSIYNKNKDVYRRKGQQIGNKNNKDNSRQRRRQLQNQIRNKNNGDNIWNFGGIL